MNILQTDSSPLTGPTWVAGADPTLLHRMVADYADWLRFLAQAHTQSNRLEERLTHLGRRGWWDWVLARFLRHTISKRNRMLALIKPVVEQAHGVLEQALTDPHVSLLTRSQLTQIHPYARLHMAEVIRLVTRLESQYGSLR